MNVRLLLLLLLLLVVVVVVVVVVLLLLLLGCATDCVVYKNCEPDLYLCLGDLLFKSK